MENNEQAMSGVQTAAEEQEISSIDKAKELFEYEMTEVLLNFKNEVSQLRDDPNAEFMKMEFKKPEFEFSAPQLSVDKVELSALPAAGEITIGSAPVTAEGIDTKAVKASVGSVPEISELSVGFEADPVAPVSVSLGISVADAPKNVGDSLAQLSVQTEKVNVDLPDTQINAPGDISADIEKPQISVGMPEVALLGELFTALVTETVKSVNVMTGGSINIDSSAFEISPPSVSGISLDIDEDKLGKKIVCPEFPEASAEIEYPEMPEKPDFSAYIEDILASVGAEL